MVKLLLLAGLAVMAAIAAASLVFADSPAAGPVIFSLGATVATGLICIAARLDGHRVLTVSCAAAIATLFLPHVALAQAAAPSGTVNLGPVVDGLSGYASAAASIVIAAAVGWLGRRLHSWFGVSIDAGNRDALHSALMTGVNAALGKLTTRLDARSVNVGSPVVAAAVEYVIAAVPDAVAYFGLDSAHLSEMALAKLQGLLGAPAPVPASVAPAAPRA